jgi:hypothetical protein
MSNKENKIPAEILKELDINEVEEIKKDFEVAPIVETHQIKLPIPRQLVNNFDLDSKLIKGKKIKVIYDDKKREIIYKL